ncbi:MAG: prolipoprotein diacylglyceryl transferase [Acidimicrobiales bacterium]|jgi:prolipoprotein diacylglyceryl transferase|nr:prolipoprotein diacylglyceryl transferase [Acidimicrobiales bacterium]
MLLASFPSPSSEAIELGPLTLRAYGLAIAFGVLAAVWLAQKRWAADGGDPDDIGTIAMWAVPAGLIGSRIYHVLTDWRFDEGWAEPFKIWEGGLGIPGGMAAGVIVGVWVINRNGWDRGRLLDACVPALPLAQAIGRIGNWFNQELFGRPTDLPWAVEIAPEHRPDEHLLEETFHPTFAYEAAWNLGLVLFLIWVGKTKKLKSGALLAVYAVGYLVARIWLETVRIDPATEIAGVRVNIWMSIVGIAVAGAWLLLRGRASGDAGAGAGGGNIVRSRMS